MPLTQIASNRSFLLRIVVSIGLCTTILGCDDEEKERARERAQLVAHRDQVERLLQQTTAGRTNFTEEERVHITAIQKELFRANRAIANFDYDGAQKDVSSSTE